MKANKLLFFFFLFSLGTWMDCYAQTGFRVIDRAEEKIAEGDLTKALKLLNRAEKMDYGFCGNAYLTADQYIDSLRVVIHLKNKDYKLARASMDSIFWLAERLDIDSIKARTYQYELGAEFLKNNIDAFLRNAVLECGQDCFGIIPLEGTDAFLKFKIFGDYLDYVMEMDEEKRRQKWIESYSASAAYQLIKKGS